MAKGTDNPVNQSEPEVITCSCRKARENELESHHWFRFAFLLGEQVAQFFLSQSCSVMSAKRYWSVPTIQNVAWWQSLLFLLQDVDIECRPVSYFIICIQQTPK